ncbi:ADP-ribosylation factor-like protein 4C [Xiphophorus maculatus]|uniref:ADP-ribosylation factor-like protein 4C n=1 Tax=Xiphophorus maculatus TaxID=8083 RepID=UPI000C6E1F89|nr:ADP-ribosylation factor-like protein 4C [Xiphophorus maculatus]
MQVREGNTYKRRVASCGGTPLPFPLLLPRAKQSPSITPLFADLRNFTASTRELTSLSCGTVISSFGGGWIQSSCVGGGGGYIKMGNSFSNISAFQSLHIVMLGLDSAGKTTVLYRLKFNEFVNTVPTIGFNTEKIRLSNGTAKGISCHFWDVGGQEKLRPLWKSYSRCTDGIIYVVDSVDVDRLEEAKTELHKVTKFAENQGTPLLVIANKQDLPKSLPVADIEKQLALQELAPSTTYHVQPACAIIGEGLHEGMDKLYEMIVKRRKSLKQKKKQR